VDRGRDRCRGRAAVGADGGRALRLPHCLDVGGRGARPRRRACERNRLRHDRAPSCPRGRPGPGRSAGARRRRRAADPRPGRAIERRPRGVESGRARLAVVGRQRPGGRRGAASHPRPSRRTTLLLDIAWPSGERGGLGVFATTSSAGSPSTSWSGRRSRSRSSSSAPSNPALSPSPFRSPTSARASGRRSSGRRAPPTLPSARPIARCGGSRAPLRGV
jgi:hypothetical protein